MAWLREVRLTAEYGRETLALHMVQFVSLREILLQQTQTIRTLSCSDIFKEPIQLLTFVPGIGITTTISLMVEIDDISRFANANALAFYIGLILICHSSGEKDGTGGITVRKHAMLRCLIIEAA